MKGDEIGDWAREGGKGREGRGEGRGGRGGGGGRGGEGRKGGGRREEGEEGRRAGGRARDAHPQASKWQTALSHHHHHHHRLKCKNLSTAATTRHFHHCCCWNLSVTELWDHLRNWDKLFRAGGPVTALSSVISHQLSLECMSQQQRAWKTTVVYIYRYALCRRKLKKPRPETNERMSK